MTARPEGEAGWARTVRESWEVAGAAGILLGVLGVIDVFAIGDPQLLLSFGPLVFLLLAAVVKITPGRIAAWAAAFAFAAFVFADERFAGLAYPAAGAAALLVLQRLKRGAA
jgi:hypothetical protein